jgi:hypothetical protein
MSVICYITKYIVITLHFEYRLYEDLRRGWRIVQPNLEQCGLLIIEYDGLREACADNALWQKHRHPVLLQASPEERFIIIRNYALRNS